METGFQVGLQQAEIMGKVIPQVTIMRLKEMIFTGELRQNFQQIWAEAAAQLGNAQSLTERVEGRWQVLSVLHSVAICCHRSQKLTPLEVTLEVGT
jgi:hypothetical protein